MITVTKESKGSSMVLKLAGTIEENVDFDKLVGQTTNDIIVNCKGVSRINSIGVKAWIKYFSSLSAKGAQLKFQECSFAIVEQINLISNFGAGGAVESLYAPYLCGGCKSEYMRLFTVDELKQLNFEVPNMKCTKCGSDKVQFDDVAEEYFYFLMQ
jgi:anti-anti-sigma regulatory factor/DNA-directed RNA polymerase subunit RPC12/RpoP